MMNRTVLFVIWMAMGLVCMALMENSTSTPSTERTRPINLIYNVTSPMCRDAFRKVQGEGCFGNIDYYGIVTGVTKEINHTDLWQNICSQPKCIDMMSNIDEACILEQPGDEEYNMVRKTRIEQIKEIIRNIYCVQSKGQFCVVIFSTDGYLLSNISLCFSEVEQNGTCSSRCQNELKQATYKLGCCFNNAEKYYSSPLGERPRQEEILKQFYNNCTVDNPGFCESVSSVPSDVREKAATGMIVSLLMFIMVNIW